MRIILAFILLILTMPAMAMEMSYLGRSPRALLMGDAYTAIADDEYTLFYNPAALGKNRGVSFTLIDPTLGITDALSEMDRFKNFPSGSGAAPQIASRIMDFPIYLQVRDFSNAENGTVWIYLVCG